MTRLEPMSVVHDWVAYLPFKMQSVLVCSLRGCDGVPKEDSSKAFVRRLRAVILRSACEGGGGDRTFMEAAQPDVTTLCGDLDHYPVQWVTHFAQAVEIVGYFHPDDATRHEWLNVYDSLCDALHVNPETVYEIERRLGTPDPRRWKISVPYGEDHATR